MTHMVAVKVEHDMSIGTRGWRLLTFYGELSEGASEADAKTVPDYESAGLMVSGCQHGWPSNL